MSPPTTHLRPRLALALVGCGSWGTTIANAVATSPEFELTWVCDPDVRRPGANWAPALTADVCRSVDAVIVATPPEHHLQPTLVALTERKPVLVEKPFVQSLAEVRQVKAARGAVPVMVGHLLVYHPGYQALGDWVRSAQAPLCVEVVRRSPPRANTRCPWWTLAPHDLALLTGLFGEPEDLRLALTSDGVQAQVTWGGARARLAYSTVAANKCRYWRVASGTSEVVLDEIEAVLRARGEVEQTHSFASALPLQAELGHFAACVRGQSDALTGMVEAEQSVRLLCWGEQQLRALRRGLGTEHRAVSGNP